MNERSVNYEEEHKYPGHLTVKFDPSGRIIIQKDVNALNRFLNRKVDDPRLRGREWMPTRSIPTAAVVSLTVFEPHLSLKEVASVVKNTNFQVVDIREFNTPLEVAEFASSNPVDLLVMVLHPKDAQFQLKEVQSKSQLDMVSYVVVIGKGVQELCKGKWVYGGLLPARKFQSTLKELYDRILHEREWTLI